MSVIERIEQLRIKAKKTIISDYINNKPDLESIPTIRTKLSKSNIRTINILSSLGYKDSHIIRAYNTRKFDLSFIFDKVSPSKELQTAQTCILRFIEEECLQDEEV